MQQPGLGIGTWRGCLVVQEGAVQAELVRLQGDDTLRQIGETVMCRRSRTQLCPRILHGT